MRRMSMIGFLVVAAASLPACNSQPGHRGIRDDGALSVTLKQLTRETVYRHTLSDEYYIDDQHGYGRVRVTVRITNDSGHNMIVETCSGSALDASGHHVYTLAPFAVTDPGRVLGLGRYGGPMGYSPRITPVVLGGAIRSVDHLEATCSAYRWEGPIPTLDED